MFIHLKVDEIPIHKQGYPVCEKVGRVKRFHINILLHYFGGIRHLKKAESGSRLVAGFKLCSQSGDLGAAIVMIQHHPAP